MATRYFRAALLVGDTDYIAVRSSMSRVYTHAAVLVVRRKDGSPVAEASWSASHPGAQSNMAKVAQWYGPGSIIARGVVEAQEIDRRAYDSIRAAQAEG